MVVPRRGLEPPRLAALVPETSASTNSATWAGDRLGTDALSACQLKRELKALPAPVQVLVDPVFPELGAIPAGTQIESGMTAHSPFDTLVTVYGGSGFLGRHVVRALAKRNYRIRVAVRRPELANFLQPLGRVGQIHAVQANLRHAPSVQAAARGADVLVNLVGILAEGGRQKFDSVHTFGAEQVALAASAHGARLVHVSSIGADENSPSHYARSKAAAERLVLAALPSATVMRPSILFGPEDDFFNRFASLARMSPVLPLIGGGESRFQPVFVGDVARATADAVDGNARAGTIYELGGPQVKTF